MTLEDRVLGALGTYGMELNDVCHDLQDHAKRREIYAAVRKLRAEGRVAKRKGCGGHPYYVSRDRERVVEWIRAADPERTRRLVKAIEQIETCEFREAVGLEMPSLAEGSQVERHRADLRRVAHDLSNTLPVIQAHDDSDWKHMADPEMRQGMRDAVRRLWNVRERAAAAAEGRTPRAPYPNLDGDYDRGDGTAP